MTVTVRYEPPRINAAVALNAAVAGAVHGAAEMLLAASQPLVPVDTGDLKASGKVTPTGPHGARVSYERLSPEGYNVAIRQHEDMTLAHPGGGQAQFLRQPLHSTAEQLHAAMAAALRAVL